MKPGIIPDIRQGLLHLFYPRLCEGCNKPLLDEEQVLCIGCAAELPETNYHHIPGNETELRFAGRIPFVRATSLAYFTNEGLLQHLLHGLKYRNRQDTGTYLGNRLGEGLKNAGWGPDIDVIIPVPLHKTRKNERGYNQSTIIARGIGAQLRIPINDDVLLRVRKTETQTHKTRAERVQNMKDTFGLKEPGILKNKHVLLCDDVLTTGATLEACALALMKEENTRISIVTIGIVAG